MEKRNIKQKSSEHNVQIIQKVKFNCILKFYTLSIGLYGPRMTYFPSIHSPAFCSLKTIFHSEGAAHLHLHIIQYIQTGINPIKEMLSRLLCSLILTVLTLNLVDFIEVLLNSTIILSCLFHYS